MSKLTQALEEFEHKLAQEPEWLHSIFGGNTIWDIMVANSLQVFTVGLAGWLLATWFERRHFRSMSEREIPLQGISLNTSKRVESCEPEGVTLLIGSVVVAHDYFRTLIIFLRRVIGGNIKPYEKLVERGRREALIRLKEEAELRGIDKVINVRFTTNSVAGRFLHAIEMVAYGTGVKSGNVIPAKAGTHLLFDAGKKNGSRVEPGMTVLSVSRDDGVTV